MLVSLLANFAMCEVDEHFQEPLELSSVPRYVFPHEEKAVYWNWRRHFSVLKLTLVFIYLCEMNICILCYHFTVTKEPVKGVTCD